MHRAELQLPVPYVVGLPVQVWEEGDFPHLDLTLEELGIRPEQVWEKVVRLDSQRTCVRTPKGRLKERELSVVEVCLSVRDPATRTTQEIRYGTESQTHRRFFRTRIELQPWVNRAQVDQLMEADEAVAEELEPRDVELVILTESESHPKWQKAEEKRSV